MTTTEPLILPITAQDKRALRHADSIVFRFYKGQGTIEANRDGRHSPDGFDQKHTIYVESTVCDYGREAYSRHVSGDEAQRYSCFEYAASGIFSPRIRTLIDRLSIGGTVCLVWLRDNGTDVSREMGFVVDELRLTIIAPAKSDDKKPKSDEYLVAYQAGRDNSARMIKIDWNGV